MSLAYLPNSFPGSLTDHLEEVEDRRNVVHSCLSLPVKRQHRNEPTASQPYLEYEWLVSNETAAVWRWLESETPRFGIKRVDDRGSNFHSQEIRR